MPAAPEVGDVGRLEGRVEVLREVEPEQEREADGDVGVPGEVEVELERVAERRQPRGRQAEMGVGRKEPVDIRVRGSRR